MLENVPSHLVVTFHTRDGLIIYYEGIKNNWKNQCNSTQIFRCLFTYFVCLSYGLFLPLTVRRFSSQETSQSEHWWGAASAQSWPCKARWTPRKRHTGYVMYLAVSCPQQETAATVVHHHTIIRIVVVITGSSTFSSPPTGSALLNKPRPPLKGTTQLLREMLSTPGVRTDSEHQTSMHLKDLLASYVLEATEGGMLGNVVLNHRGSCRQNQLEAVIQKYTSCGVG